MPRSENFDAEKKSKIFPAKRRRLLDIIGFLFFILLPFGQWPYYVFGNQLPLLVLPWREYILFVFPFFYLVLIKGAYLRKKLFLIYFLFCTFLAGPALYTIVFSTSQLAPFFLGVMPYLAIPWLLTFFVAIGVKGVYVVSSYVSYALIIGGAGIALDYFSGSAISGYIFYGEKVNSQIMEVTRNSFLYTSVTASSAMLGTMLIFMSLVLPVFYGHNVAVARWRLLVVEFCAIAGIFFTFSRVGYVVVAAYFSFLVLNRLSLRTAVRFAMMAFIITVVVTLLVERHVVSFFVDRVEYLDISEQDMGSDHRVNRWLEGIKDIPSGFLMGTGVGTGNTRNAQYIEVNHYESTPLWVLNETGVLGFFVFFFPYFYSFYLTKKAFLSHKERRPIYFFLVALLFSISVNPGGSNYVFLIIITMLCSLLILKHQMQARCGGICFVVSSEGV